MGDEGSGDVADMGMYVVAGDFGKVIDDLPVVGVEVLTNTLIAGNARETVVWKPETEAMHNLGRLDMGMVEEDLVEDRLAYVADVVIACMGLAASVLV